MRIYLNELKKILNWKVMVVLFIVNAILFFMFIEFWIVYFPNGHPAEELYQLDIEMLERYGIEMSEQEKEEFAQLYLGTVEEANAFIQSREEFAEAGIHSYEELASSDLAADKELFELFETFQEENANLVMERQARGYLVEIHESEAEYLQLQRDRAPVFQRERFGEMIDQEMFSLFSSEVIYNYQYLIKNIAMAIFISVAIVIAPTVLSDKSKKLVELQYTSTIGRKVHLIKALAGFSAAAIVVTGLLVFYLSLYSTNGTLLFWEVPVHLFSYGYFWYDPTFLQYVLLTIVAVYVLSGLIALISFTISTSVSYYTALIGIHIPILFLLLDYGLRYLLEQMISISMPKAVIPTMYGVLILLSVSIGFYVYKREMKRDVLNS